MKKKSPKKAKVYNKPSIDEVIEIRKQFPEMNMKKLAKKYNTSLTTISNIVNLFTWKNI